MKLKTFLEQEGSNSLQGVVEGTMNRIDYIKRKGRRALEKKSFPKFDSGKEYAAGKIRGPKGNERPQKTYFRVTINADKAEESGDTISIDDYSAITKIEYVDGKGNWKNIRIPKEDVPEESPEEEIEAQMKSGKKAYGM